jgi:hypothetical protein
LALSKIRSRVEAKNFLSACLRKLPGLQSYEIKIRIAQNPEKIKPQNQGAKKKIACVLEGIAL